jgi:N-acyl-phosphatidylethanolamine-hydrolysing phospholipase D
MEVARTRFGGNKPPYVPVPHDQSELVQVLKPDLSSPPHGSTFKVTWIGHASFLLQCALASSSRTVNILLDPVFSERTSPFTWLGPKRYRPPPLTLDELLQTVRVDVVCISHNHYDHADTETLKQIYHARRHNVVFCVALGNSRWLTPLGIPKKQIWEADWWDQVEVSVNDTAASSEKAASVRTSVSSAANAGGVVRIVCTPCQHSSARTPFDKDADLWCSFAIEVADNPAEKSSSLEAGANRKSIYFSGDTGYRTVPETPTPYPESDLASLPVCTGFAEIGQQLGPFDLALLPIGLCHPRAFMSPVHCNSYDSLCVHRDVKAKKSVGMHYGTVRGGLSEYYEDVRVPPKEWQEEAAKLNLKWRQDNSDDWEVGLMAIGESLLV